ncbi:hypothetical protein TNCV_2445111 [Trichonephila clavipes]|nr:hypothetical protein TNCV_2445111 [Trichonephila clavipes]
MRFSQSSDQVVPRRKLYNTLRHGPTATEGERGCQRCHSELDSMDLRFPFLDEIPRTLLLTDGRIHGTPEKNSIEDKSEDLGGQAMGPPRPFHFFWKCLVQMVTHNKMMPLPVESTCGAEQMRVRRTRWIVVWDLPFATAKAHTLVPGFQSTAYNTPSLNMGVYAIRGHPVLSIVVLIDPCSARF